jgi:hypothetical protein
VPLHEAEEAWNWSLGLWSVIGDGLQHTASPSVAGLSATTMPGGFHRLDLVLGAALAARDDGARMAHAAARRRGAARDEAGGRLPPRPPGSSSSIGEELRPHGPSSSAAMPPIFADHDDRRS